MTDWSIKAVAPEVQPETRKATVADMRISQPTERPLNWREAVLLDALHVAIGNGWKGWRTHINDAVTVGQEAEGVLRDYRKGNKPLEPLLFDHDFARAIAGDAMMYIWLQNLAVSDDRVRWLKENIWNG